MVIDIKSSFSRHHLDDVDGHRVRSDPERPAGKPLGARCGAGGIPALSGQLEPGAKGQNDTTFPPGVDRACCHQGRVDGSLCDIVGNKDLG